MADCIWLGSDDETTGEDWNLDANWDRAGLAAIPATDDDIFFVSGAFNCTGQPTTDLVLGTFTVGPKYTGTIGASGTPIENVSCTAFDFAKRQGDCFVDFSAATGIIGVTKIQDTSTGSPALHFTDTIFGDDIHVLGGSGVVTFKSDCDLGTDELKMIGCKGVTVEIEAGADAASLDVQMNDGRLVTYEQLQNVTMFGGLAEFRNVDGATTSITMYDGTCKYKPTGAAVLATLIIYSGFFDMRGCTSPAHTIILTQVFTGGMIDERNGLLNTIYGTALDMQGGLIKTEAGRTITIA